MASPSPILPAGRRISHFEIVKPVGQGAMGTVYAAKDLTLQRTVALKIVEPGTFSLAGSRDRFLGEARKAAKFSHPNIVSVFEFGEEKSLAYLAMELIEGQTLDRLLAEVGRFTPRDCVSLLMQAVAGLSHAFGQGTIHRDVKPANLVLGSDGRLRILDFGLARAVDQPSLAQDGMIVGTPDYMSPEQALGQPVDFSTDIYALGIVLYQMLSGDLPFPGQSTLEVLRRRTEAPPPPLERKVPGLAPPLLRTLNRCLALAPAGRYPSYDALGADLLEALAVVPDRTVLPRAAQLASSQIMSLASLRQGPLTEGGDEDPAAAAPLPRFPPADGPRLIHLPVFLLRPLVSMAAMAQARTLAPAEPVRVWGEVLAVTWVAGLVLAGSFWPQPGPLDGLVMALAYGAAIRGANAVQGGSLGLVPAFTIGAWCTAPCILMAVAPTLAPLASIVYLVLAVRLALASDLPGIGRRSSTQETLIRPQPPAP